MEGTLEVVVYRGRNLAGKKNDEKPTSSVEIKLGKEAVGTRVVENNSNPQWNTVHRFENIDITNSKLALELTLRDKKEKFAGRIRVPISENLNNPDLPEHKKFRLEQWFPILDKKLNEDPSITGDIQVKMRFLSKDELKEKEDAKARAQEKVQQESANQRDKLLEGKKPKPMIRPVNLNDDLPAGPVDNIVDEQTQQVLQQTERVRQESRDSTIRTMQKINEAQEVGTQSLEKLDRQGEQLRRIVGDSEQIEDDMKIAARNIRGIKSIWGAFANKFSKSPSGGRRQRSGAKDRENSVKEEEVVGPSAAEVFGAAQYQQLSDEQRKKYEEDAVDRDLEQISSGINNLKSLAMDIGKEIDSQTGTIDKLMDQTEKNEGLIRKHNTRIARH